VAALLTLGALEHLLLVLPLPTQALWAWGLRSRQVRSETASSTAPASAP